MPRIELRIPPDLHLYLLKQKPETQSLSKFCALLIEQKALEGVDRSDTLGAPSAAGATSNSSSKEEEYKTIKPKNNARTRAGCGERSPYSVKAISTDLVPDDLLDCQQLLPEFWAVKKGVRSESVWKRVCAKLRGWTPEQRREALERAIASGWGDVFEPPALRPLPSGLGLSPSGTPLTVNEQIAQSAIAKIRAMEDRRAAA
jgi:hypothetical protein